MKHFQSIIAIICAMFAFAMMAYFTRQANTDILTIATWRAILVALLFFVAAFFNKELQFFSKDHNEASQDTTETEDSTSKDISTLGLFSKEQ